MGVDQDLFGFGGVVLVIQFDLFVFFQVFVVFEEVVDVFQLVVGYLFDIFDMGVVVEDFGDWYGQDFFVVVGFIVYFEYVDWMVMYY